MIASSIELIISQRLVRKICVHCQGNKNIQCDYCQNSRYFGRIGVFEFLEIDSVIKDHLNSDYRESFVRGHMQQKQNQSLSQHSQKLIDQKITDKREIQRVFGQ